MQPFASGAPGMVTGVRVSPGRFTAIGRRVGTPIRQRYAPMFSICFTITPQGELTRTRMKRWGAEPTGEFSRTTIVSVLVPVRLTSVVRGVFGTLPVAE